MSVKVEMSPWHIQATLAAQLHMISTHYTTAFSEKEAQCPSCRQEEEEGRLERWFSGKKCLLTVDMESELAISYDPEVSQWRN